MKDILIEFTEYGAIIHKDSAKIESLKDLPHCFFNPDLSNVSGVSPSFWSLDESGTIVKASQEEIVRRNEYLTSKPAETPSLKTTLDGLKQEILEDTQESIKQVSDDILKSIDNLQIADKQIINTLDAKIFELENQLFQMEVSKEMLYLHISEKSNYSIYW
jgi:hypothetical protein